MANKESQAARGLDRRTLLRTGFLTGAGLAVVGATSQALTGVAKAQPIGVQPNWAWCASCSIFYYGPNESSSHCPATGTTHFGYLDHQSWRYTNEYGYGSNVNQQANWLWCRKCQGLFYGPNVNSSRCPASPPSGHHDGSTSYNYDVAYNIASTSSFQINWRWCSNCQGMWYGPNGSSSKCPTGDPHVIGPGSYNYGFPHP
jgi:hypothetical protein